jgi:hypothetical protein
MARIEKTGANRSAGFTGRFVWDAFAISVRRRLIVGGLAALAAFFIVAWGVVNFTHRAPIDTFRAPIDTLLEIINGNGDKKWPTS